MLICTCACGETELTLTADPIAQFYCHCHDCRKLHGGLYTAESIHAADAVTVTRGEPRVWTLARTPRHFCGTCGVRLFAHIPSQNLRGVNGLLLPEGRFTPTIHVNCASAVLPVPDGLPHYKGMPTSFGGASDDLVDW